MGGAGGAETTPKAGRLPRSAQITKIVTDAGEPVAEARDQETAEDIASRLNNDHAREEDDRWA
jgi:hypothetical protein